MLPPCVSSLRHQAIDEMHDALRIGGHVRLVGDHDDGDALVAVQRGQQLHDFVAALAVQIAGRLVGQQHQAAW